ncbi:hypothetical protein TNCV_2754151 [Trichonephila clavipes]|nr:hypothetical protein TNCV_2754151 [Trichonephila clavipes]
MSFAECYNLHFDLARASSLDFNESDTESEYLQETNKYDSASNPDLSICEEEDALFVALFCSSWQACHAFEPSTTEDSPH